jgi:hypothetical protein
VSGTAWSRSLSLSGAKQASREYRKSAAPARSGFCLWGDKTQRGYKTTINFIAIRSAANAGCGQFYTV